MHGATHIKITWNVQVRQLHPKLSKVRYYIFKESNEPWDDKNYLLFMQIFMHFWGTV
jgi:hypothetical protein